jgi:hypothetical protein
MDLNLQAEEATISTNRLTRMLSVSVTNVDKSELVDQVIDKISIDDFVAAKGSKEVFDFLANVYPELLEKEKE